MGTTNCSSSVFSRLSYWFICLTCFDFDSNFAYISVSLILLQLLTTFHMLECNEWTTSRLLSFFSRKKIASESFQGNLMHLWSVGGALWSHEMLWCFLHLIFTFSDFLFVYILDCRWLSKILCSLHNPVADGNWKQCKGHSFIWSRWCSTPFCWVAPQVWFYSYPSLFFQANVYCFIFRRHGNCKMTMAIWRYWTSIPCFSIELEVKRTHVSDVNHPVNLP